MYRTPCNSSCFYAVDYNTVRIYLHHLYVFYLAPLLSLPFVHEPCIKYSLCYTPTNSTIRNRTNTELEFTHISCHILYRSVTYRQVMFKSAPRSKQIVITACQPLTDAITISSFVFSIEYRFNMIALFVPQLRLWSYCDNLAVV